MRPDDVREDHGLGAETVRVHDLAVLAHRRDQPFAGRRRLLLEFEVQELSHSGPDYSQHPQMTERINP